MRFGVFTALVLILSGRLFGQEVTIVPPEQAQKLLQDLIPAKKKFVTINAYVAGTFVTKKDLGMSCSSSSSGSISGTVDDNGEIRGQTDSSGSSHCRERYIYYNRMMLGLQDASDPDSAYMVTAECAEKWVWDHCQMPEKGTIWPVVIEAGKHGTFDIYEAVPPSRLGGKWQKAARFHVLDVSHVKHLKEAAKGKQQ